MLKGVEHQQRIASDYAYNVNTWPHTEPPYDDIAAYFRRKQKSGSGA